MRPARTAFAAVVLVAAMGACSSGGSPSAHRASATTTSSSRAATTTTAATAPPTTTTTPATGELASLAGHTIVVDAGHNGGNAAAPGVINRMVFIGTQYRACDTTGTETDNGYPEHAYTLDVALRLQGILAAAGAHVVMVRTTDTGVGPCIDERAAIGNRAHAEAGISIHADGGPPSGHGFHVNTPANIPGYTDDIYAASHRLGVDFRDAYVEGTGMPPANYIGTDGIKERTDFGGLNLSDVPKVLFETGNMRNAGDALQLQSPAFRQRIAQAMAIGFAHYFAGR
jgi:N-acetylmuramoyl-L-alanine amidase